MSIGFGHCFVCLSVGFIVAVSAGATHFDLGASPQMSHSHQSRRTINTDYYTPQLLLPGEQRVANVTTQIGTNAFLPCKVRFKHYGVLFPCLTIRCIHRPVNWPTNPSRGSASETIISWQWTDWRSSQTTATRRSTRTRQACGRCRSSTCRPETPACTSVKSGRSPKLVPGPICMWWVSKIWREILPKLVKYIEFCLQSHERNW